MTAILNNPGFLASALPANDDGFTAFVPFGFAAPINFYGLMFTGCYVSNNGYVTFDSGSGVYTPYGLQGAIAQPIIAPLFLDVDTRAPGSAVVTYGADTVGGRPAFGVNWVGVGYYDRKTDRLNSFQLVIIDRSDIADGDFDFWFDIGQVRFETGDASGGASGLGGVSASSGYSNGSGVPGTYAEFNGSRVPGSFLDTNYEGGLAHNSLNSDVRGRYIFRVRGGLPPAPPVLPPAPTDPGGGGATVPTGDLKGAVTPYTGDAAHVSFLYGKADAAPGYEIDRIPIGDYSVLYARCGFVPQVKPVVIRANRVTTQDVALVPLDPADAGDGFLAGVVVDAVTAQPVAGATVSATQSEGWSVLTDVSGAFVLYDLPPGDYTLAVVAPGYDPYTDPQAFPVSAGCTDGGIVIALPPPAGAAGDAVLFGYVEDAVTQAALPGALVSLVEYPSFTDASGPDGAYRLNLVPAPQTLTLYAGAAGYRPRRSQVQALPATATRVDIGLVPLADAVGGVEGFVTAGGSPVAGAVVRVPGVAQAVTTNAGYYLLVELPVGAVAVQCLADGFLPAQADVTVTSAVTARQDFALSPGDGACAFIGQVRDAVTGQGIEGAALSADVLTGSSGPRGAYVLSPVPAPPLAHTLKAASPGYYPLELTAVPARPGDTILLDLGLVSLSTPVGRLHGFVFDARHEDIRLVGALVSVGRFLQALATSPGGEYLIPYLPADADWAATGSAPEYLPLTFDGVIVSPGETLELDFPLTDFGDLASVGSLLVSVTSAGDDLPLAGALVDAGGLGLPMVLTGADGTALIPGVPLGQYTVAATLPGYRVGSGSALVAQAAAPTRVAVVLRGFPDGYAGGQIYGHVTAALIPPGQAVAGCVVEATGGDAGAATGTDSGGFYVLDGAPAGTVSLLFDDPDYVPLAEAVTAIAKEAVRADAVLSPWDGRLPPGWKLLMGKSQAKSRPVQSVILSLGADADFTAAREADTIALFVQTETTSIARFRRVLRYDCDADAISQNPLVKTAVAFAPGVTLPGGPASMTVAVPPPKADK